MAIRASNLRLTTRQVDALHTIDTDGEYHARNGHMRRTADSLEQIGLVNNLGDDMYVMTDYGNQIYAQIYQRRMRKA